MENSTTNIEKLFEKAEIYTKTSFELCKFNAIYKSANIFSSLAVKLIIAIVVVLFLLFANIGLALWVGELLGEIYYGFFAIATVYLLFALLIFIFRNSWIKKPVSNFIISQSLK